MQVQFYKVQYRDLGKPGEQRKSDWFTMDGEIEPSLRSWEIPGLIQNHAYRSAKEREITFGHLDFSCILHRSKISIVSFSSCSKPTSTGSGSGR